jgi:hypothetical protein
MRLRTNPNIRMRRSYPAGPSRQANKPGVRCLTLQGLIITGGNTSGPGGGIFNLDGMLTLNHRRVTGALRTAAIGGLLPTLTFWLLPSAIGAPVITRAVIRARTNRAQPRPVAGK